ncbi:MAG: hypothetical protein AAGA70_03210 [Pseudomonadota bacterium]
MQIRKTLAIGTALLTCLTAQATGQGFSISTPDGAVIAGGTPPPYRPGYAPVDDTLRRADVTVQFDSLLQDRLLNVGTEDLREGYAPGEVVRFRASTNYPAFIERAEIRIIDRTRPGRNIITSLPIAPNGTADWTMPADGPQHLAYVLRVYAPSGRFDETIPAPLRRQQGPVDTRDLTSAFRETGAGEDRTAIRNIPVRGGTVTVSGTGATPGATSTVMGDEIAADGQGRFAISRILPVGDNVVEIETGGRRFLRDVYIPPSDWFTAGIIDITAGLSSGGIDDDDGSYIDGRAAVYATGMTASGWRVTASADTEYGSLEDIFSRLDDRDPLRVLDRLREDGTDLYPTYGDDSTWIDSTPTSGNLFLRLENDTTRLTWGDFTTSVEGPGLLRHSRDLYGAELEYRSAGSTSAGQPRFSGELFAATPDSLPQRDILRGTGGSLYFLSRRDLVGGSSTVTIEETDADTGFVITTQTLTEGRDYVVDHLQGVLILSEPLQSGTGDGTLVTGVSDARVLNLVVQYEYVPSGGDVEAASYGGRADYWITDALRVGVTVLSEETGAGRQDNAGIDLSYSLGGASGLDLEVAFADGPGFGRATSTDGGLTLATTGSGADRSAGAYEARLRLDFSDLGLNVDGSIEAYAQRREEGFDTIAEATDSDQSLYGIAVDLGLTERTRFGLDAERFRQDTGEERAEAELRLSHALNAQWTIEGALAWLDQTDPGDPDETGTRTDAAIRLSYAASDDLTVYGFAQGTIDVDGGLDRNDRAGVGFEAALGDRVDAAAEISGGEGGAAGRARIAWRPTDRNEVYLGYSLDPTRGDTGPLQDRGRIVAGASMQHSDQLLSFGETVFDMPDNQRSLTQAYGVTYTPSAVWSFSGGLETGTIRDADDGDFDRLGLSVGAAWTPNEDQTGRVRLEYRTEDGDGADRDRDTYALSAGYATRLADDWRLLADVDAIYSDSADDPLADGEYLRASLGYAYRPIDNERLNLLFRLTYLHDLPAEDQRSDDGSTDGPQQRSTVMSVAGNYDLNPEWTLSAKLGYRLSEVADRGSDDFTADTATLAALRLDWHVVHQWDLMVEGRVLYTEETGTTEAGAVVGIYRHVNDHVSVGLGYEWGSVSDDLTNIDYDGQDLFLNIVGRF